MEIHKKEAAELMTVVDAMEKENLEMMGELFECHVDDLKISRYINLPSLISVCEDSSFSISIMLQA